MAGFIQKVASLFSKPNSKENNPKGGKAKRKVKKKVSLERELETMEQLRREIDRNGYCSMKVKSLFQLFGYKQRGSANVPKVLERLDCEGLFISRRVLLDTDWNKKVRIYRFPVEQLGHIFRDERTMEDTFAANNWYRKLGLEMDLSVDGAVYMPDRQFKPDGTKDRLDFKARDSDGNHVVVELKHKGGDNRLVEQALRYRTHLMSHYGTEKVRCVIITGIRCLHTAKALYALPQHDQELISWYVYDWDKGKPNEIAFEPVPMDYIKRHLADKATKAGADEGLKPVVS